MDLHLDQMSIEEKLRIMEVVWDDLCRDGSQIPSPDWHGEVLLDRESRLERGDASFSDWQQVKRRLRQET